jgi:hypothetical protein
MKKLAVIFAVFVSSFGFGQDLLRDSTYINYLIYNDTATYKNWKSGDNDFYWSHGLLKDIFTDTLVKIQYVMMNPKISNLLVHRDGGFIKKDDIPFVSWIKTELDISKYPLDIYTFRYRPAGNGRHSESLSIINIQTGLVVRTIRVNYSAWEYDSFTNSYFNLGSFSDDYYEQY